MKKLVTILAIGVCMFILASCNGFGNIQLVNTVEFENINQNMSLDYDADDIKVLESDNNQIMLKEYMNKDKEKYYAEINTNNSALKINEGKRPLSDSFESYIEIYIPKNYSGSLDVHSTSGIVECDQALSQINTIKFDTTSGLITVSNLNVDQLKLSSTDGEINVNKSLGNKIKISNTNGKTSVNGVTGSLDYTSKGGKLTGQDLIGSGNFDATGDGTINLNYNDVTDNISIYSKNESISLNIPSDLTFSFKGIKKEGEVKTFFDDLLSVKGDIVEGVIGSSPSVTIELETRNGDIFVSNE